MKLLNLFVLLMVFFLLPTTVTSEISPLLPQPNYVEPMDGEFLFSTSLQIVVPDQFKSNYQNTVLLLENRFNELSHSTLNIIQSSQSSDQTSIVLSILSTDQTADRLWDEFPVAKRPQSDEGYLLFITPKKVVLAGKSGAGLYYAAQTFLQLIHPKENSDLYSAPAVKISDSPDLKIRGVMIDSSQGMIPNLETVKRIIRVMGEYKLNRYYLYSEDTLEYPSHPLVGEHGGRYTPDEIRELVAYGAQHYVDIVPCVQFHGHLHNVMRMEKYSDLAEIPHGGELSPGTEGVNDFIKDCVDYLTDTFPASSIHVGGDETYELGTGRSRERFPDKNPGDIYLTHSQQVQQIVCEKNRTPEVWGDIVLNHPEIIPKLAKNLRIMSWSYFERNDWTPLVKPFADNHLSFVVCPGVRNWMQIYPNFKGMRTVIRDFMNAGRKYGTDGILNTLWIDTCEELYSLNYYGFAFGAAAGWSQDIPDDESFDRAFAWTFHRDPSGEIMKIYSEMLEAQLIAESLYSRSSLRLSWLDPFTEENQKLILKWEPQLREMRIHAENAMEHIYRNRQKPFRNLDTLDFIEYAARRIDLTGLKLQYGPEMSRLYHSARDSGDPKKIQLAAIQLGASTKANKCRIYDLIFMTGNLKSAYRDLWLRDNKPYNIEGTLALWDMEIQRQWKMFTTINNAWEECRHTGKLPAPETVNFYVE